jgi:hypothetical protein
MSTVVDGQLLLELMIGSPSRPLRMAIGDSDRYTTVSWYFRLARAADHGSTRGALSAPLHDLDPDAQLVVREQLGSLQAEYQLVPARDLVPAMAALGTTRSLNFLSADALATAILTESTILVRTHSPPLADACDALAVPYRIVS